LPYPAPPNDRCICSDRAVQYHPELSLAEVAAALRRQASDLLEQGLARSLDDVETIAVLVDDLEREPDRADLAWQLGLDRQVTDVLCRRAELRNFIKYLVRPTMSDRGRGCGSETAPA
jgi:GMP synthase (glutamine-hydrolysing)